MYNWNFISLFIGIYEFYKNHENHIDNSPYYANEFVKDNIGTLASNDKRSNGARYSMLRYHIRLGLSHPILGVGKGLHAAYAKDYLTENEKSMVKLNYGWMTRKRWYIKIQFGSFK